MRRTKPEAVWRYRARWHLVEVMTTPEGESWWPFVAPFSVCGNARLRYGKGWAKFSPGNEPYVRCATCRRLAKRYKIVNSREEKRS